MDPIRRATPADAAVIAAIYNHYIDHTVVTFEETPVTVADMARRMEDVLASHDWLVATRAGDVVGYAYAARFRERVAYRFTTESTVYLSPAAVGLGLGRPLYEKLIERVFALGYRHTVGVIALPNDSSVRLHEQLGFVKVAHYPTVGKKFGRWIDVGAWQLENPGFDAARALVP